MFHIALPKDAADQFLDLNEWRHMADIDDHIERTDYGVRISQHIVDAILSDSEFRPDLDFFIDTNEAGGLCMWVDGWAYDLVDDTPDPADNWDDDDISLAVWSKSMNPNGLPRVLVDPDDPDSTMVNSNPTDVIDHYRSIDADRERVWTELRIDRDADPNLMYLSAVAGLADHYRRLRDDAIRWCVSHGVDSKRAIARAAGLSGGNAINRVTERAPKILEHVTYTYRAWIVTDKKIMQGDMFETHVYEIGEGGNWTGAKLFSEIGDQPADDSSTIIGVVEAAQHLLEKNGWFFAGPVKSIDVGYMVEVRREGVE